MPIVRMVKPVKIETPSDFDEIWSMVKSLRAVRDAPVDIWGCDKVVDIKAEKKVFEFQILVAAMLSSQTKDRYVKEAMDNLRASELSVSGILAKTEDEIDTLIKMVGFHKTKARNISTVAKLISKEYSGHIPRTYSELLKLPGIGPKMANMIVSCAFNECNGIIVDTHIHRICTALRWGCRSCSKCKQPEHTRQVLEQWVPRSIWRDFSLLLVGLGQQVQQFPQIVCSRSMALPDTEKLFTFLNRIGMNISEENKTELYKVTNS